jgi:hypothetical protein
VGSTRSYTGETEDSFSFNPEFQFVFLSSVVFLPKYKIICSVKSRCDMPMSIEEKRKEVKEEIKTKKGTSERKEGCRKLPVLYTF